MPRHPKTILFQGQLRTIAEVAALKGMKPTTIHGRLARNQSLDDPPRYGRGPKARKRSPRREQGPVVPVEQARSDYVASVVAEFGKPGNPTDLKQALLAAWDSGHSFAKYGCRIGRFAEQERDGLA